MIAEWNANNKKDNIANSNILFLKFRVVEIIDNYLGSSQLSSKAARKRRFLAVVGNGRAHCQRGTCKERRDEASIAKFPRRNISHRVLPLRRQI